MKKFNLAVIAVFFVSGMLFAQEWIKAKKEILFEIPIDTGWGFSGVGLVYRWNSGQIFSYQIGPSVGTDGSLYIFRKQSESVEGAADVVRCFNKKIESFVVEHPRASMMSDHGQWSFDSENGIIGGHLSFSGGVKGNHAIAVSNWTNYRTQSFSTNFGALVRGYLPHNDDVFCCYAVVFDENTKPGEEKIYEGEELKKFLENTATAQSFRYNCEKDRFYSLNMNSSFFSGGISIPNEEYPYRYCCTLESGHILIGTREDFWGGRKYAVADRYGNVLCFIYFPWVDDKENYGAHAKHITASGNYGEIYCLIPPATSYESRSGDIIKDGTVEVVVTRTHLKKFGVLTEDNVILREEPAVKANKLGKYMSGTGFYIMKSGKNPETIDGKTGVWHKVKLHNGTEGYFFGAYVKNLYDGPGKKEKLPWKNVKKNFPVYSEPYQKTE